jgi:hypothetical protein
MGPHQLRLIAETLIACLAFATAACAHRRASRAIIRWRTSRLPAGVDAERAREELEGVLEQLNAAARARFVAGLLRSPALSQEIAERAEERAPKQEKKTPGPANSLIRGSVSVSANITGVSSIIHHRDITADNVLFCIDDVDLNLADLGYYERRAPTLEELRRHASEPAPLD